ncbi:MAG TPA: antibiotic biosynthesis monooxygenase family protein [Chitinophagales bacterium]
MITRLVKMTFRKEEIEQFKNIFAEKKAFITAFSGCEKVNLFQDKNDERIFFTISIWQSEEALENYRHSELFRETWAATKVLFDDKPEAWSIDIVQ